VGGIAKVILLILLLHNMESDPIEVTAAWDWDIGLGINLACNLIKFIPMLYWKIGLP
jgi:hypothetical protein